MARDSSHVWIIDELAKNFSEVRNGLNPFRIWLYGFSPSIAEQSGGEDKYEFADSFVRLLRRMRADSKV
jgi:hypothetical protein